MFPVANRYKIPITAKTNKIWIKLPTASPKAKYPIAQPTIKITTINQIKSLIIFYFLVIGIEFTIFIVIPVNNFYENHKIVNNYSFSRF